VLRLANALHRPRTFFNRRIGEEDAPQLKHAHALGTAVEIVFENIHQTADKLRTHHRKLRRDWIQQTNGAVVSCENAFPVFRHKGEVDELLITLLGHFTAKRMLITSLFAARLHRAAGQRRTIREFFESVEAGHFLNQILFDFNIKAERRRNDGKDTVVIGEIEAETLEACLHRFDRDFHSDHLAAAINAHLHGSTRRQSRLNIRNGTYRRFGRTANVEHEPCDVFKMFGR